MDKRKKRRLKRQGKPIYSREWNTDWDQVIKDWSRMLYEAGTRSWKIEPAIKKPATP